MRNYSTLSSVKFVTRKGFRMSRRQALPIAKLLCEGFESRLALAGYIADYLQGIEGAYEWCESNFTSSEFDVITSFKGWYCGEYFYDDSDHANDRLAAYRNVCFTYHNLNTGFSLVFLDR